MVSPLRSVRREWVFVLVSIVVSLICVSTLKATTGVYCAYELLPYGGAYPANEFSNLWQGDGACWPGGHVSGPFSLIALYFAFRSKHDVFAILALVTALVLGTIFGAGQALRGAHFPSHTLWTLLIIWVINMTLMKVILSGPSVIQANSGTHL